MMDEEDRDIDLEFDGVDNDDLTSESGLGGQYDNKRALHNAMERKRRDSIKDSFRGLQDCIPTLRGDKTSRAQVLKKTGEYITHMQRKINDHQGEIKDLKSQNGQLESQIRALEKAKATGNYVNVRAILETDSLLGEEDGDLSGMNSAEIIYDDTSSDASDSANAVTENLVTKAGVTPGPSLVSVSLPSVPGVSLSLPTMVSSGPSVPSVTSIQPGQSLLTSNRVQPGQSLLLSEPMRKKMKIATTSLI